MEAFDLAQVDDGVRVTVQHLIVGLYGDSYKEEDWVEPNRLKYLFRGTDTWCPEDGSGAQVHMPPRCSSRRVLHSGL